MCADILSQRSRKAQSRHTFNCPTRTLPRNVWQNTIEREPHAPQRWADCEMFQSESNPDPQKLNPIQSWSAHVKPCVLFCFIRQNNQKLVAFSKLNKAVFFAIRGKSTAGVILLLREPKWYNWSSDKDDAKCTWVSAWFFFTWPKTLYLNPKPKPTKSET